MSCMIYCIYDFSNIPTSIYIGFSFRIKCGSRITGAAGAVVDFLER